MSCLKLSGNSDKSIPPGRGAKRGHLDGTQAKLGKRAGDLVQITAVCR